MRARCLLLGAVQGLAVLTASFHPARASEPPSCRPYLTEVDRARAALEPTAAREAWRAAHIAALRARTWECLVAAGDAASRMASRPWPDRPAIAWARELYLGALFRARAERSLHGVLQVAEAFAVIGDRSIVDECLRVAERLNLNEPTAAAAIAAFRARLSASSLELRLD